MIFRCRRPRDAAPQGRRASLPCGSSVQRPRPRSAPSRYGERLEQLEDQALAPPERLSTLLELKNLSEFNGIYDFFLYLLMKIY